METDWNSVKEEYVKGKESYRELADRRGLPRKEVSIRGKQEGWVEARRQHRKALASEANARMGRQESARTERLMKTADRLLGCVNSCMDTLDTGAAQTKTMKDIVDILKGIQGIQGIQTGLDTQEQKARIRSIEAKVTTPGEVPQGEGSGVILLPEVENPQPPEEDHG